MKKKKVFFLSLGCDKNLVDSEMMLGMLEESGYIFTDDENEADVVIVNTCCFIGDAKEESIKKERQRQSAYCDGMSGTEISGGDSTGNRRSGRSDRHHGH